MRWFTVNYRERGSSDRAGNLVNVGFWLKYIPRPLILCRVFGHRPVVDGYGPRNNDAGLHAARWVVCDRCAVRPDPQGSLDHTVWNVGDRYTGSWADGQPEGHRQRYMVGVDQGSPMSLPGRWPSDSTGTVGGQLVVGRSRSVGVEVKVGNTGSEHHLAFSLRLGPLGALYLHTERFGSGLVRRLNGSGQQSKVTGLAIHDGWLWWSIWRDRNGGWCSRAPWRARLRNGSVRINPLDLLLGPSRYSYMSASQRVAARVWMPHGDSHEVVLQLEQRTLGRKRWPFKRRGWSVDWTCDAGIPTKPGDRGRARGSAVDVSASAVEGGTWRSEAAALIAVQMTRDRSRYDWGYDPQPEPGVVVS